MIDNLVMFFGIVLICGSPMWMALFILYEMFTDNWDKQ